MTTAEFPDNVVVTPGCGEQGMKVLKGAPNRVRGGSHSGNVAAAELAVVQQDWRKAKRVF